MSNYDPKLVGAVTDRGLYRQENEDAFWQPDRTTPVNLGALYIVADGVGGQEHGGIAARMAVAVLSDAFYRARTQTQSIPQALKNSIEQANQAVFDEAAARGLRMGATVVTAVHHEGTLYIAHVGDSRAYLVTEDELKLLTCDDSLVQQQLNDGVITPAEAAQHQFRNLVTQVLGNKLEIDVHLAEPRPFSAGETLILCSDGLSGVVESDEMLNIAQNYPASAAAEQLVEAAKKADSQDNITAVVVAQSSAQSPLVVPIPDAPHKSERVRSVWLWAGILIFFLVVTALLWWRNLGTGEESAAQMEPTTSPAFVVADDDAELRSTLPMTMTVTPETAVIEEPTPLSEDEAQQVAVTQTAVPTATATPEPTATPAVVGCVNPNILAVYVWEKEDLTPETCAAAIASVYLDAGEPILILQPTPETLAGSQTCTDLDFVEVQSQLDETIQGWVLESQILPEEECP
ncbi:MAG: hypothetical protein CSA11_01050 [Chloroflexi bacterium]|nr:MAG: hypothetical protein CSA11_01050 [Chloroflexota bacterium]